MSAFRALSISVALIWLAAGCARTSERGAAEPGRLQHLSSAVAADVADIRPGPNAGVVFVDAMKQAEPWSSRLPLLLDANGNVRFLAPGQIAEAVVYRGGAYPAGDYALLYAGNGTFDLNTRGVRAIARAPGRIVLRIAPQRTGLRLRLIATDSRNPIRDVRLVLPGFERSYAGAPFQPQFVARLGAFHALCFKDWMHAETFVASTVWPDRPTTMRSTQVAAAGVAPEYMVALSNAAGADPWFTLPVGATDMYIYQFAALVHQTLDPRLHATFEYGHGVDTPGTPGNAYAAMAGHNFHLADDSSVAARAWYHLRSAQMMTLVKRAFGRDAERARALPAGVVASAPLGPLSGGALERSPAATVAGKYMPALPTPPPVSVAPPLPLAATCRSPQCARLPDSRSQPISPGLAVQQRHRSTMDDDAADYRT